MKPVTAIAMAWLAAIPLAAPATAQDPAKAMVDVRDAGMLTRAQLEGQALFDGTCAACHGTAGSGQFGLGPPLIHRVYEPSHHGNASFVQAVAQGVRAHHWRFGNMPPQPGVTKDEVLLIVNYIRALQRANGID
ncbi:cytochrome c [Pseudooceanicola sp.]|uniref:c-type cytochrome n=1 Tax=Pseudooceanicola sp. TaxID=1914328 RepID=UPI00260ED5F1|nr:cytochrome c [Pseudooceanicola sp.]MDF1854859.1 cytochrome c [Pseudooceanicola sp.]